MIRFLLKEYSDHEVRVLKNIFTEAYDNLLICPDADKCMNDCKVYHICKDFAYSIKFLESKENEK